MPRACPQRTIVWGHELRSPPSAAGISSSQIGNRAGGGYEIRTREGVNPTRFPSERHRPLGESSAGERTRASGRRSNREGPRCPGQDPRPLAASLRGRGPVPGRRGRRVDRANEPDFPTHPDRREHRALSRPRPSRLAGNSGSGRWGSRASNRRRPRPDRCQGCHTLVARFPRGGISPNPPRAGRQQG